MKYLIFITLSLVLFSCNDAAEISDELADTVYVREADSVVEDYISSDSLPGLDPILGQVICTEVLSLPPYVVERIQYVKLPDGKYDTSNSYQVYTPEEAISQNLYTCKQFWWEKDTLAVKFIDPNPDPVVISRIKETAKTWEQYCSIVFDFENRLTPDITVSLMYGVNESCVGNTSKWATPSLKLTGLRRNSPQELYNKYVLHEFGHAIGLFHEQQTPNVDIPWNEEFLFSYYGKPPNGWSKDMVRKNILNKPHYTNCVASAYDNESIMIYEILPSMVKDRRYATNGASKLSRTDIENIQKIYPKL
ncbi:MAG: hypothetical protein J0M30_02440 [Chitinophagales bacterium]|nr:hypothetical protein [Chitinophagales bacterium]